MDRIRDLGRYQKFILIFLALMLVVFSVLYPLISSRRVFKYMDTILLPESAGSSTVYSGKIDRQQAAFTVTADKSVTFQYGNMSYGPYTAKIDPTAIPNGMEHMTGVEIRQGDEVFFRGAVARSGSGLVIYGEDGSFAGFDIIISASNGIVMDADGNIVDPMEPSASTILNLMDGPELESKGDWQFWFYGLLLSILTVVSILFADELFRWNLAFQIRNVHSAEPSDWELMGRYIGWTVVPVVVLVSYIVGLVVV